MSSLCGQQISTAVLLLFMIWSLVEETISLQPAWS